MENALANVLAGDAGTDTPEPSALANTDDGQSEVGTVDRQLDRLYKITKFTKNIRDFAIKVADTPSQAWGADLRTALDALDSAAAEASEALAKAPADYKHPRKGVKSAVGIGDKVQIAESFRDEYKGLLVDIEFGTTAIAEVKSVDEKNRATVWFGGGQFRTVISIRKLVHACWCSS